MPQKRTALLGLHQIGHAEPRLTKCQIDDCLVAPTSTVLSLLIWVLLQPWDVIRSQRCRQQQDVFALTRCCCVRRPLNAASKQSDNKQQATC